MSNPTNHTANPSIEPTPSSYQSSPNPQYSDPSLAAGAPASAPSPAFSAASPQQNTHSDPAVSTHAPQQAYPSQQHFQLQAPSYGHNGYGQAQQPAKAFKGFAISSLILGILGAVVVVISLLIIASAMLEVESVMGVDVNSMSPAELESYLATYPELLGAFAIGGLLFLASGFLAFLGVLFGVIALVNKTPHKVMSIIGVSLGALTLLLVAFDFIV